MSDITLNPSEFTIPRRVYMLQTSGVVYQDPDPEAETVVRLNKGEPFDILPGGSGDSRWWKVQTSMGQTGYLKATTRITIREQLLLDRKHLQRGWKIGWSQFGVGVFFLLIECFFVFSVYLYSQRQGLMVPQYSTVSVPIAPQVYYLVLALGVGNILMGLVQLFNVRRALKEFDTLWKEALPWVKAAP